jgi:hypothetical protein
MIIVNSQPPRSRSEALRTFGIAARPTLLFVAAFALNVTPHEAVHAGVAYLLGFNSTLFQMWVNPDAATASARQAAAIAAAGPIFSLVLGAITWLLYKWRYSGRPSGLIFLMLAVNGIYAFLGPLVGTAFGGDFNIALKSLGASQVIQAVASITGLVSLPTFMFFMGKELSLWAPLSYGRAKNVLCTTCAPWFIGSLLILLVYWPLPTFLIGPTLIGSVFWFFAVLGASFSFSKARIVHSTSSVNGSDLAVMTLALIMVRMVVHGFRLVH